MNKLMLEIYFLEFLYSHLIAGFYATRLSLKINLFIIIT